MIDQTGSASAPMTGAEFRSIMERIGLTIEWVADTLNLSGDRDVRRWCFGTSRIPVFAQIAMLEWQASFDDLVTELLDGVEDFDGDHVTLTTYRSDEEAAKCGFKAPARLHRLACAQVQWMIGEARADGEEVPAVTVAYFE